jgi:hypothetical protein
VSSQTGQTGQTKVPQTVAQTPEGSLPETTSTISQTSFNKSRRVSQAAGKTRRSTTIDRALEETELASEFVPLTLVADERVLENGTLVRLTVPRARLIAMGVPLQMEAERGQGREKKMLDASIFFHIFFREGRENKMRRRSNNCWLVLGVLLALNVAGGAQDPPGGKRKPWGPPPSNGQQGERRGPPDGGPPPGRGFGSPSFEMFSDGKVVKGAPYSASAVIETVQTLADGAKIINKKTDQIYRDSEGRTRREQTFDRVGPFSVDGQAQQHIFINDVVAGTRIFLDPGRRTARQMPTREGKGSRFQPPPPPPDSDGRKTESLGKQMIEGLEAEGRRTTITIPTGKIGNDRPLQSVSERWVSTELQIVVLSKHKDPFMGETTYQLVNINRSEPPHSLFEIPSDYTIEEGGPGGPPWGERRKPPHE